MVAPKFRPNATQNVVAASQSAGQVLLLGAGQSHHVLGSVPFPSLLWKHGSLEWFGLEGALNLIPF